MIYKLKDIYVHILNLALFISKTLDFISILYLTIIRLIVIYYDKIIEIEIKSKYLYLLHHYHLLNFSEQSQYLF